MQITWFGTATVLIESENTRILFDPFSRMNRKLEKLDCSRFAGCSALFLSHGHFDHVSAVPEILSLDRDLSVYCTATPRNTLKEKGVPEERIKVIEPGNRFTFGGVEVRVLPGRHIRFDAKYILSVLPKCVLMFPKTFQLLYYIKALPENGEIVSYEITAEGKTVVLMGSFGVAPEADYRTAPDLFVFPFSGNAGIEPMARAFLARLQPKHILFDHFDDSFPPLTKQMAVEAYCETLKKTCPETRLTVPREGVGITI